MAGGLQGCPTPFPRGHQDSSFSKSEELMGGGGEGEGLSPEGEGMSPAAYNGSASGSLGHPSGSMTEK